MNLTFVVLGVLVALLQHVLALQPMHQAWLECLITEIRRCSVLLFLFVFVLVITMTAVTTILPLVVMAIALIAMAAVTIVTSVMLFQHTADLLIKRLHSVHDTSGI